MARCGIITISVIAVIVAMLSQEASALRCWDCNENDNTCNDEFTISKATGSIYQQKCPAEPNDSVVCVKTKKTSGVRRECSTKKLAEKGCAMEKLANNFCEYCETDLCNGNAQFNPVALIILISVAIAKILSF